MKKSDNNSATKKDIQILRSEFKSTKKSLFGQMLKLEDKVQRVEEKLGDKINGLETKFDKMMNKLDKIDNTLADFAPRVQDLENENTTGAEHTRELREQVDSHEKRIKILETTS